MPREKSAGPKISPVTLIAIAAAIVLGIAFFMTRSAAAGAREASEKTATGLSNDIAQARTSLDESRKVIAGLATKVEARSEELAALSNQFATVSAQLTNATDNLKLVTDNLNKVVADAQAYSETALEEVKKRDQAIKGLAEERGELEKRLLTMNTNFGLYEAKIAEVQRTVANAEKVRLTLIAQNEQINKLKVYWENQFNDPAALRERLEVLKKEPIAAAKGSKGTNLLDQVNLNLELLPSGQVRLVGPPK